MKLKFIGTEPEVFPSLLAPDGSGTLVCEPGDVVDLDEDPNHSRLVPVVGGKLKAKSDTEA